MNDKQKWSEARINAYIRYIENDEASIRDWKISLQQHKEGVERAEGQIESTTRRMKKTIEELEQQGVKL